MVDGFDDEGRASAEVVCGDAASGGEPVFMEAVPQVGASVGDAAGVLYGGHLILGRHGLVVYEDDGK